MPFLRLISTAPLITDSVLLEAAQQLNPGLLIVAALDLVSDQSLPFAETRAKSSEGKDLLIFAANFLLHMLI